MGITDITLITPPESSPAIEAALATNPALTSLPNPKPEVLAPADLTHETGTGELLRLPAVQNAIIRDFAILPCDLISEVEGTKLLQQWMTLNPLPAGSSKGRNQSALAVFYPTPGLEGISHKKDETDFLATISIESPLVPPPHGSLRSNIEQVVLNMPTDTLNDKLEEDKGFLRLRQSLMDRHGKVKMRMKHRDAGVYVFPKWVKDFAHVIEKFDSISEDVLGWWAKATWQEGLGDKLSLREVLSKDQGTGADGLDGMGDLDDAIDAADLSSTKASTYSQTGETKLASRVGAVSLQQRPLTVPPLLAYIQPAPSKPLIRRVDTSPQLLSVSLYLAKQSLEHPLSHNQKVHSSAQLEQQSRVSQEDSLIGENVKLGFRSNIKESVIGANCEIGKNVRMVKCLLMEGVVVGDGAQLTSCVVGRRARIEGLKPPVDGQDAGEGAGTSKAGKRKKGGDDDGDDRTKLTDCEIAPNYVVEAGTVAKEEKMMGFDTDGDLDEDIDGGANEEGQDFGG